MGDVESVIRHATSRDGTRIGFHTSGEGPPLVLVHGTAAAAWSFRFVVPLLVGHFTVHAVDRRGRGESGDSAGYSIEREFEDVAAVLDALGGPAAVFGHSFGATAALGASLLTPHASKLVLYEPSPGLDVVPGEELGRIEELVERGAREEALEQALRLFGLAADEVEQLRASPTWPARVAAAHTIVREVRAEEAYELDAERLRDLHVPVLFLLGEESPDWAREGTERLCAALPDARVSVLRGQGHAATMTAPELVADELVRFLGA